MTAKKFAFDSLDDALRALASRLRLVDVEKGIAAEDVLGRVLAEEVRADRDSPAADVSAMDGYAIRLSDLQQGDTVSVHGQCAAGSPPPTMPTNGVLRIFTGAIIPIGCQAVVKREDTEEFDGAIRFRDAAMSTREGEHIRRAGENAKADSVVLSSGIQLHAAHRAAMENFGCVTTDVYRRVRVSTITTGDEVGMFRTESPQPWQLYDSNWISLRSLLGPKTWIEFATPDWDHGEDDREALTKHLERRLAQSDAVILTGGVSMGDYDYVPDIVRDVGGEVIFHGLPMRPGKPILGAATSDGKLILGLPGNPVSATIGCRRMAIPLLSKISGQKVWLQRHPVVRFEEGGDRTLPLHWLRLVRITDHGVAQPVTSQGSGDLVSLARSDGFVELPPGASGEGPWPYCSW